MNEEESNKAISPVTNSEDNSGRIGEARGIDIEELEYIEKTSIIGKIQNKLRQKYKSDTDLQKISTSKVGEQEKEKSNDSLWKQVVRSTRSRKLPLTPALNWINKRKTKKKKVTTPEIGLEAFELQEFKEYCQTKWRHQNEAKKGTEQVTGSQKETASNQTESNQIDWEKTTPVGTTSYTATKKTININNNQNTIGGTINEPGTYLWDLELENEARETNIQDHWERVANFEQTGKHPRTVRFSIDPRINLARQASDFYTERCQSTPKKLIENSPVNTIEQGSIITSETRKEGGNQQNSFNQNSTSISNILNSENLTTNSQIRQEETEGNMDNEDQNNSNMSGQRNTQQQNNLRAEQLRLFQRQLHWDDVNVRMESKIKNLPTLKYTTPELGKKTLIKFLYLSDIAYENFEPMDQHIELEFVRMIIAKLDEPFFSAVRAREPRTYAQGKRAIVNETNFIRPRNVVETVAKSIIQGPGENVRGFYYRLQELRSEYELALQMEDLSERQRQVYKTTFDRELLQWGPNAITDGIGFFARAANFSSFEEFKEFLDREDRRQASVNYINHIPQNNNTQSQEPTFFARQEMSRKMDTGRDREIEMLKKEMKGTLEGLNTLMKQMMKIENGTSINQRRQYNEYNDRNINTRFERRNNEDWVHRERNYWNRMDGKSGSERNYARFNEEEGNDERYKNKYQYEYQPARNDNYYQNDYHGVRDDNYYKNKYQGGRNENYYQNSRNYRNREYRNEEHDQQIPQGNYGIQEERFQRNGNNEKRDEVNFSQNYNSKN